MRLLGDLAYPLLGVVLAYLYPLTESCRAVLERDEQAYHQWLTYWMVFFLIRLVEGVVDIFMSRLPFYREIKLVFITWLVLPRFKGASIIYHGLIHKYLDHYERDIDGHIVKITHQAQQAAWDVSTTVVKETSGVVARAASRLVMSPNGMTLVRAAIASTTTVASQGSGGQPRPSPLDTVFSSDKRVLSRSLPAPLRDTWSGPDAHQEQRASSMRLPSPVGSTTTHLLAKLLGVLEDGVFVHLAFDRDEKQPEQAPSLHLLRLSANRKALVYDDVTTSKLSTLPLVSIVTVRGGPEPDSMELQYIHDNQTPTPSSPSSSPRPPPARQQQQQQHGRQRAPTRRLMIVVGKDTDKDAMLAGFRVLSGKVREPFARGARIAARTFMRRCFRHWSNGGLVSAQDKKRK